MPDARLTVNGARDDLSSLREWLQREPELRGRVRLAEAPSHEGTMGATPELVVAATAAAGVLTALAKSVSVWLIQRRSDVEVTVTQPDGRKVSVTTRRTADLHDAERLLLAALKATSPTNSEQG